MEIPLASDHYGHIGVNSCIKLARAMEKWNLAWMEDMVPWEFGELLKQIKESTTTPILTGEDIYLKEDFIKLIDMGALDMIHPGSGQRRRTDRNQEDWRLRDGTRRRDGHAFRRHARSRSWQTSTAPRRPRISSRSNITRSTCPGGRPRADHRRAAARRQRIRHRARRAGAWSRIER